VQIQTVLAKCSYRRRSPVAVAKMGIMSIVDEVDILYTIYAIGIIVFMAFFAYKLTRPRPR